MANPPDHLKYSNFPDRKTFDPRDLQAGEKSQNSSEVSAVDAGDPFHQTLSDADRLLDVNALAEWLGVSKSTLAKWRLTGTGPPFLKCGKKILHRQRDVSKWLDHRRRLSTSDDGFDIGEF